MTPEVITSVEVVVAPLTEEMGRWTMEKLLMSPQTLLLLEALATDAAENIPCLRRSSLLRHAELRYFLYQEEQVKTTTVSTL